MTSVTSSQLYHARTRNVVDDLEALSKLVGAASNVLEVGCGTGRILEWLINHNSSIECLVGVELDCEKSAIARSHLRDRPVLSIFTQDFLTFTSETKFHVVLFAFNVFAEFLTSEKRVKALAKARDLLRPNGRVIIILFAHDFKDWAESTTTHNRTFNDPELGHWSVDITCARDPLHQLSNCEVKYKDSAGNEVQDRYELALITRNELLATYIAAGLTICEEYGSYAFEELTNSSKTFVHILKISHL